MAVQLQILFTYSLSPTAVYSKSITQEPVFYFFSWHCTYVQYMLIQPRAVTALCSDLAHGTPMAQRLIQPATHLLFTWCVVAVPPCRRVEATSVCHRGSPLSSMSLAACPFLAIHVDWALLASEQSLLGLICIGLFTLVSELLFTFYFLAPLEGRAVLLCFHTFR